MVAHPTRRWNGRVRRETGIAHDGCAVVRGTDPKASGKVGDILVLLKEEAESPEIEEVALFRIDRKTYQPNRYYGVYGTC